MTSFQGSAMLLHELKETLVTIDNVSLKFGDKVILKPITVDVKDVVRPGMKQGQVVGILGPSGIGKSQFSRIIAGLQAPTSGCVKVMNDALGPANRLQPVQPGTVGVVFQNYPLFTHRTVLGNLLVALEHDRKLTSAEKREKVIEFLTRFDLLDKQHLYPIQLSGGQRQRVSIIQQLLSSGNFLIMDEPFTGLDPLMKDKVCDLIDQVATMDEKNTMFVVAHDIAALVSISDTLWIMGRDRDSSGNTVPGAYIKHNFNLIERDLAWHPGISSTSRFNDFVNEVKELFKTL